MLNQVLNETNKFFVVTCERGIFNVVADGIEGDFVDEYLVGQYVSIDGTKLNDGVYKVLGVTSTKLTLDATLLSESATIDLYGLAIPRAFIELVDSIAAYVAKTQDGLSSESQGGRSVSFKDGSSWKDVFKSRLNAYRASYSDKIERSSHYNIRTKGY